MPRSRPLLACVQQDFLQGQIPGSFDTFDASRFTDISMAFLQDSGWCDALAATMSCHEYSSAGSNPRGSPDLFKYHSVQVRRQVRLLGLLCPRLPGRLRLGRRRRGGRRRQPRDRRPALLAGAARPCCDRGRLSVVTDALSLLSKSLCRPPPPLHRKLYKQNPFALTHRWSLCAARRRTSAPCPSFPNASVLTRTHSMQTEIDVCDVDAPFPSFQTPLF